MGADLETQARVEIIEESAFAAEISSFGFELFHLWLFVSLYAFLHCGAEMLGLSSGDPLRVRVIFTFFVITNIASALMAWQGVRLVPVGGLARDVCYFFGASLLFASTGNGLDLVFWVLGICPLKTSTVVNGLTVAGIIMGLMGMWKLARLCRTRFRSEGVLVFFALSTLFLGLPEVIHPGFYRLGFEQGQNSKEILFGLAYAVSISGISAIAFQIWFFGKGYLVIPARILGLGTVTMAFGCAIYGVLFVVFDSQTVAGNPVHLVLGVGYLLLGLGSFRLGQTALHFFSPDSLTESPSQPLIDLLGPHLGTKIYEAMLGRIRDSQLDLLRAEILSRHQEKAIQDLEAEIAARKRIESELKLAKEAAEEADSAKTQFLAMMSHEFRTPLTPIRAYSLLLADPNGPLGKTLAPDVRDIGKRILKSSEALERLINSILQVSRADSSLERNPKEEFAVGDLVAFMEEVGTGFAGNGSVEFSVHSGDSARRLFAHRQGLELIASNLLGNAFKFTASGSVRADVFFREEDLVLQVKDTGRGIPADICGRVFEPFFQGSTGISRNFGGVGLGLCIVQKLTTAMAGKVVLESEEEAGTTVTITIPGLEKKAAIA